MHSLDDATDVLGALYAGRIQAIGTGVRVGDEPRNRRVDVRLSDEEALGASDQQHILARRVDRAPRRANALDRRLESEQRAGRRPARGGALQPWADGILDRKARDPALDREAHALGHARRISPKTVLEVRV